MRQLDHMESVSLFKLCSSFFIWTKRLTTPRNNCQTCTTNLWTPTEIKSESCKARSRILGGIIIWTQVELQGGGGDFTGTIQDNGLPRY